MTTATTEPLDLANANSHVCVTFDQFHDRDLGAPGQFSQVTIPAKTLAMVTGAQGQLHRAEGRELTTLRIGQMTGTGDRPVGMTVHWKTANGLKSATDQQMHHTYGGDDGDGTIEIDRYHHFTTDGLNNGGSPHDELKLNVDTIPLDKAKATAARWDGVDANGIGDAIKGIRITDTDGNETEHALIPKASALGQLYTLNKDKAAFKPSSCEIKTVPHGPDNEDHWAVPMDHATNAATQLKDALADPGKIEGLTITAHFPDHPGADPLETGKHAVHGAFWFGRREADPIGVQTMDEDGKTVDHGSSIELPPDTSPDVLTLVQGGAAKVETIEEAGGGK